MPGQACECNSFPHLHAKWECWDCGKWTCYQPYIGEKVLPMCREGAVEIDGMNHRFCWTDGDSEALCVCSNKHAVRENKVEFPNVSCPNCGRMHGIGHFTPRGYRGGGYQIISDCWTS
jgi:hypothetical protein